MNWCFGIVNNRLAEVFFDNEKGKINFIGHAYVKESEYKTRKEKKWIKQDTANTHLVYRKGVYYKSRGVLARTPLRCMEQIIFDHRGCKNYLQKIRR